MFWGLGLAASLFGQTRLEALWGQNLDSLSFPLLLLPYPVWYARSALAARKYGVSTLGTKACLLISGALIAICITLIAILSADIFLYSVGLKSDIPIIDFNTVILAVGLLNLLIFANMALATHSLRTAERAFHKPVIHPVLGFFAFMYLPIGMFFLKSRFANLKPNTTFD